MCVTVCHMTLAVKVALNPSTTNQSIWTSLRFSQLVKGQVSLKTIKNKMRLLFGGVLECFGAVQGNEDQGQTAFFSHCRFRFVWIEDAT